MKRHMSAGIVALLCMGLFCSYTANHQAQAQGVSQEKITVLTPLGHSTPHQTETNGAASGESER
jgi:hypothetical protein